MNDSPNSRKSPGLIGFVKMTAKAVFISIWAGVFLFPAVWHLTIEDKIYYRMRIWKPQILKSYATLPFIDLAHRINYPLHNAALKSQIKRIHGRPDLADQINNHDYFAMTPLAYAILSSNLTEVQFMYAYGADPEFLIRNNQTAINIAINLGREEIVIFLIESGASTWETDISGKAPIHYLIEKKMTRALEKAMERKHDPSVRDSDNLTPLDYAIRAGSLKMTCELAINGAQPVFSVSPRNHQIADFLARWQKLGNAHEAIVTESEWRTIYDFRPAELPDNVIPETYQDIREKR